MAIYVTLVGRDGRIWQEPRKPKRKRFCAWFERGLTINAKFFPTRKAATEWLRLMEATHD